LVSEPEDFDASAKFFDFFDVDASGSSDSAFELLFFDSLAAFFSALAFARLKI
jgi:hypothetical protein